MRDLTLGQKLRDYRKRAGFSQLSLELEIEASPGFISRIESGKVNPTKETIKKISEALGLSDIEVSRLYGIDLDPNENVLALTYEIISELELETALKKAVAELANKLEFVTVGIFLFEGENLRLCYVNDHTMNKLSEGIIGKKVQQLFVNEKLSSRNILLRSALDKKVYESSNFLDFTNGAVNDFIGVAIAKATKFRKGIAVPLFTGKERLGCIYFSRNVQDDYTNEIPLLVKVSNILSIEIMKLRLIQLYIEDKHYVK